MLWLWKCYIVSGIQGHILSLQNTRIMYDTLHIWQRGEALKDSGCLYRLPAILTKITHSIRDNGIEYITGNLENLKVSISENGLSIKGSINKFWHGNNFCRLTRQETELGIEKLQDLLQLSLYDAEIKRIDVAQNLIMNEEAKKYYCLLGDSKYYTRLSQPDSIYYNNGLRTKLFYNKMKEGKSKGQETPQTWQNKNVIRYELRFMKRLPKQFKKPHIYVSDLYDEEFYIKIIDLWTREYLEIKKNKLLTPKINSKMTNKDAKEYLLSALIDVFGQNEVNKLAEQWKDNFSTNKEAHRFKKSLQELKGLTEESPLIKELDEKVMMEKDYYK